MKLSFKFGENWQRYLEHDFSEERLAIAKKHLLKVLHRESLEDSTFLDVGCGSGIHSLAAYMSGAKSIMSVDIDEKSVQATRKLWSAVGEPTNWTIKEGSALDRVFMSDLNTFDIVYSWGVLHHTGQLWKAIQNVVLPMHNSSILYIALYAEEMYQNPSTDYWIDLKRRYNKSSDIEKELMEYDYAWNYILKPRAERGDNPLIYIKDYKKSRGMEFWTDVRDWIGGYPMEFAKTRDVLDFTYENLSLELLDIHTGEGNTEFVFKKVKSQTYIDSIFSDYKTFYLTDDIIHDEGHCYSIYLPEIKDMSDTDGMHYKSRVMLLEDDKIIGYPHARFSSIQTQGEGRFAHWKDQLFFSATDNSDPRKNNKKYSIRIPN